MRARHRHVLPRDDALLLGLGVTHGCDLGFGVGLFQCLRRDELLVDQFACVISFLLREFVGGFGGSDFGAALEALRGGVGRSALDIVLQLRDGLTLSDVIATVHHHARQHANPPGCRLPPRRSGSADSRATLFSLGTCCSASG